MATRKARKARKTKVEVSYGKPGAIAKRAKRIYAGMKAEYQKDFKAARGDEKKVKAAAADYRKKYGATPRKRWGKAMRLAKRSETSRQTVLF